MKPTETVAVRKLDLRSRKDVITSEEAPVEMPLNIYVNAEQAATLFATPTNQEELAIGYLIGEGILRRYSDIRNISWSSETASVKVHTQPRARVRIDAAKVVKVLTSACGSTEDFYRLLDRIDSPLVRSDRRISATEVSRIVRQFNRHSTKLRRTASFQSAAAFFGNKMEAFFEDVGLDNAVSKALGKIIKTGRDTSDTILMSSGRQSASEVIKAARVGIPVIASVRGPTYSGVRAAEKTGVTLCCFVTETGMRVYSGFDRIVLRRSRSQLRD